MSEHEVELTAEERDLAFIETLVCGCTEDDCPRRALVRQVGATLAARLTDAESRLEVATAKVARVEALADELAHPDTDLIVAYERAVHRNIARDLREALRGDQ